MDQSELLAAGIAQVPEQIIDLIARGAMFVINHSGGKDSQAMCLLLRDLVPVAQRVIVHADLGEVEWPGAVDHIKATTSGEPLHVCRSRRGLLQMIEDRGMFPSPKQRQCTSDLKRGPIERTVRHVMAERMAGFPKHRGIPGAAPGRAITAAEHGANLVVNCMGMRAQESSGRSKLSPFKFSECNSKAGREWYDWLPIHSLTTDEVFERIAAAGQAPHWVYAAGMSRFSCCFCIMSSKADLTTAARLNPDLYRRYVELERSTGQVMIMPSKKQGRRNLEQITGISAEAAQSEIARVA